MQPAALSHALPLTADAACHMADRCTQVDPPERERPHRGSLPPFSAATGTKSGRRTHQGCCPSPPPPTGACQPAPLPTSPPGGMSP